jgi:hypothetical protein
MILNLDCREGLAMLPDNSIDAVVTDPPYELGFMGKSWDNSGIAYNVNLWREVLRVLKPGGHMLAFGGSRTYHRMACAIEDSGFEIRDQIMWIYGSGDGEMEEHFPVWVYASGFPKSHNLDALRGKSICGCSDGALQYNHENTSQNMRDMQTRVVSEGSVSGSEKPHVLSNMQSCASQIDGGAESGFSGATQGEKLDELFGVRGDILAQHEMARSRDDSDLLSAVQREDSRARTAAACPQGTRSVVFGIGDISKEHDDGCAQPCVEGRSDSIQKAWELFGGSIREGAGMGATNVTEGRLCNGTPLDNGGMVRETSDPNGMRTSPGSCTDEQRPLESGTVAGQSEPQTSGAWPLCRGCGKPVVPRGIGTALKPAHEPICVARKPLGEKTVAANVLAWGTGGINIDGCRVGIDLIKTNGKGNMSGTTAIGEQSPLYEGSEHEGRWPANLIHDGSPEVLEAFPNTAKSKRSVIDEHYAPNGKNNVFGTGMGGGAHAGFDDVTPSAARFFYCAKASRADRDEGLTDFESKEAGIKNDSGRGFSESDPHRKIMRANYHPTVKPTDLMRYLCRLITPAGG